MQLNPSEISELIKSRIQNLGVDSEVRNQGTIVSVADGICRVHGLSNVMQGEMLEFPNNTFGLALNLERDSVGAVILGEYQHLSEGDTVKTTGRILEVPVGPELIGRVVDALGNPIDGKGPINAKMTDVIEKVAPGVIDRRSVSQPVQTGLKSPSARRLRPSPTSCASSKSTARWTTRSWSPLRRPSRPRCSTSRPTPVARWASTSATAARTR